MNGERESSMPAQADFDLLYQYDYRKTRNHFVPLDEVESLLCFGAELSGREKVTVIVPTYNRAESLKETLQSLAAQDSPKDRFVVLVVDNSDEDYCNQTIRSLKELRTRLTLFYYRNVRNLGMYGNWNRGIQLAQTAWVTLLHDDDLLYPGAVSNAEKYIARNVELFAGKCKIGDQPIALRNKRSEKIKTWLRPAVHMSLADVIINNITPAPGIFFKRSLALDIGGIDADLYPVSDYVFQVQLLLKANICLRIFKVYSFYRTALSETYKGEVLWKMAHASYGFKLNLIQREKPGAFWSHLVLQKAEEWGDKIADKYGPERRAEFMRTIYQVYRPKNASAMRPLGQVYFKLRGFLKQLIFNFSLQRKIR